MWVFGKISNYYGTLIIKEKEGKYYWRIDDWNGYNEEEIPKELYDALVASGKGRKIEDEDR